MQIKHIGFRVRGFYTVASFATKEHHMSVAAQQKRHALIFWENHGLKATMDHANVSRSTLYAWRKTARERGMAGLTDGNKASRHRPKRTTHVF